MASTQNQLDEIAKNLTSMAAQISDLARKMSTLEPLVPLAAKLDKLSDRVTQVQASAFEYSEQVRALNLAVERVEASQRAATTNPSGSVSRQPRDNTPPQDDADARSRRDRHGDDTAIDNSFLPRAKLEFPTYDGKGDPLPWLNRCETFRGQKTPETRKVWYASLHLIGDAQLWYYRIELNSGEPSWRRFVQLVHTRFGPPMTDSPLGELTALRRTGTVEDYVNSFLALACRDVELSESQQVQLFTAGLVNPLKTDVALCRPRSLDDAIMLARAYEQRATLGPTDPSAPRTGRVPRPSLPASSAASASASTTSADVAASTAAGKQPLVSALPRKRLSPAEMAQRRSEGLCYNCDEKYVAGHRCKKSFVIEVISFPEDTEDEEDSTPEAHAITLDEPSISLHALASISAPKFNTIKVWARLGSQELVALLDSGSTHNFINDAIAHQAGVPLQRRPGLSVAVANGDRVPSPGRCPPQRVSIGSHEFDIDFYALPLGGYDIVLGAQWLGTLGPTLWDFSRQSLAFGPAHDRVTWTSIDAAPAPAHAAAIDGQPGDLMTDLLDVFKDLFTEPHGLSPERHLCHRIRLEAGVSAVAVGPYRYAHIQKDELERQCDDMLRHGVIRPSSSAFSSPALLIKKRDGSWRFCVDYRALNDKTIKDKFPIPVAEELFDELRGAKFFTKLDMRSGYHQVLMHPDDVHKTAFRTHQGLFEFLVMPFGLTNAPATFQALMNDVLLPFLRRFVLVFFDDILIYSSSWSEHLRHVRTVLQTLQDHCLHLKRSKCEFGLTSVAYLGHVISGDGVAMDRSKVQAVLDWPVPKTVRAVRGFLGLAGYYRRFIRDFGAIAAPLTALLRKEGFRWSDEAAAAFRKLQHALTAAPVLQLPDFNRDFIVECDASGTGLGAVLHQGGGPVAFFSTPIAPRHAKLAAYERELIGLVKAVRHW
jgi:hypothetical protein